MARLLPHRQMGTCLPQRPTAQVLQEKAAAAAKVARLERIEKAKLKIAANKAKAAAAAAGDGDQASEVAAEPAAATAEPAAEAASAAVAVAEPMETPADGAEGEVEEAKFEDEASIQATVEQKLESDARSVFIGNVSSALSTQHSALSTSCPRRVRPRAPVPSCTQKPRQAHAPARRGVVRACACACAWRVWLPFRLHTRPGCCGCVPRTQNPTHPRTHAPTHPRTHAPTQCRCMYMYVYSNNNIAKVIIVIHLIIVVVVVIIIIIIIIIIVCRCVCRSRGARDPLQQGRGALLTCWT